MLLFCYYYCFSVNRKLLVRLQKICNEVEAHLGCREYEGIGKIVVGVMQLDMVFTSTDSEKGSRKLDEVVGKIFGPTKGGNVVLVSAHATGFDIFNPT